LESEKRGIYTGTIGLLTKNEMTFNVPIRTVIIDTKTNKGEIGIGSGVVWDSDPDLEYEETLLKSRFLSAPIPYFELIETLLIENGEIFLPELHLSRVMKSADYFLFKFDKNKYSAVLRESLNQSELSKRYKLRLTFNKWGGINHSLSEIKPRALSGRIVISSKRINSANRFQYFKTTHRNLYEDEYKYYSNKEFDEVLFLNENNNVAEGAITNIFLKYKGLWYTPKIRNGVLNGCYRTHFMNKCKNVIESDITLDRFRKAEEIILTNSIQKELNISECFYKKEVIWPPGNQ